jgi:hypothetical protein
VKPRAAVARAVVCLLPATAAGVLELSLAIVVGLALVGVVVMLVGVGSVLVDPDGNTSGSAFAAASRVRRRDGPRRPRDLERMQTLVAGRTPSAIGVHQWLRPLLADIAATRLRRGHGLDLTDPAAARYVPEPLWELIRPDRPEPADRNAAGLTPAELAVLVDQLEAL